MWEAIVGAIVAWFAAAGTTVAAGAAAVGVTVSAAVGTAIVEGVVVGAVIGAASSAISGDNILEGALKGALIGGVTGGAGAYLGEALSGVAAGAESAVGTSVGTEGLTAADFGADMAADAGTTGLPNAAADAMMNTGAGLATPGATTPGGGTSMAARQTALPDLAPKPSGLIKEATDPGLSSFEKILIQQGKDRSKDMWTQIGVGAVKDIGGALLAPSQGADLEKAAELRQNAINNFQVAPTAKALDWKSIFGWNSTLKRFETSISAPLAKYQGPGLLTGGA